MNRHNIIVVSMIPDLIDISGTPWRILPEGIHFATIAEISDTYGKNPVRRRQFEGLVRACAALSLAGCRCIYLDGSYVTGKPRPGDYDACWDPSGVSVDDLDPTFLNFDNSREAQKVKYEGEFFPFAWDAGPGQASLDFFQTDSHSGERKGIIAIDLTAETFDLAAGGKT
jgi:hypothetical protein